MCYNNISSLLPAGESPHLFGSHHQSPFADNSRLLIVPKNCASCQKFNWINSLNKKLPAFQQLYPQK